SPRTPTACYWLSSSSPVGRRDVSVIGRAPLAMKRLRKGSSRRRRAGRGARVARMDQARAQGEFGSGIDGGGNHARVACVGLDGTRLSIARGGGAAPMHNDDAEENVRSTLARALSEAGLDASGAAALVAGMAGFERTSSPQGLRQNAAVERSVELDGLTCTRAVLNDAVIAHRGALSGRAGVVVVAGTGSMILAIDEQGADLESGQFGHYAGAARHLARDVVERILLGES